MPELESKLEDIVKGVEALNAKHAEFESKSTADTAESKAILDKIKEDIVKNVEASQKERTELAAIVHQQKEDFEMLQKSIIAGTKGGDEGLKSAFDEYNNHFAAFMKKGIPVPAEDVERIYRDIAIKSSHGASDNDIEIEVKTLVAGSNVDGGFFLTTDRSSAMSKRIFETSPMRPLADIQTTTSDVWEIILDDGEPDAGWVGEVSARPDTNTAGVGLIQISIHELYAKPKATQKMLDDAGFDIAAWHQGKVTRKFGRIENTSFTIGDGSKKPKGFSSYPAWDTAGTYQRDAVEQHETATATSIEADDLIALQGLLIEDYQNAAQWAMKRQTFFNNILTLKDSQGAYLINPRLIAEGGRLVLLGQPVNLFNDMPIVANNSLSVAIADWREFYTIVDRMGIRVLRDPFTETPYIKFYTTKRVGGAVTNFEAGKILKTKSS